jgi:hypothetical protein
MVCKKINTAGPGKAGHQSYIKLWPMVEHAKKFFWHHHTLHQQLSFENSLAGTKNNTQLLQVLLLLLLLVFSPWASCAGTRAQSGEWYGSCTLHPVQVLTGSLPLLSPALKRSHFCHQVPPGLQQRERS